MAVEIFIEPELENLKEADTASEWFELASELGLNKQVSLADRSEEKKAPPYSFVDPKTEKIIRTLCPRKVKYSEYDASTIPVDVLKEIQTCIKNDWYQNIYVLFDDKSPDPFVIGYIKGKDEWRAPIHMIARWGAELLPFEQLEIKAVQRLLPNAKKALSELKHKIEYGIENPEDFIGMILSGEDVPSLDFSIGNTRSFLPF